MSDDPRTESFKRAFAEGLARRGLTPGMVEKQAKGGLLGILGGLWGGLDTAAKWGVGLGLGLPVLAGGALGYGAGRAEGVEPPDLKAMQEEERINNIRRAIKALKRQQGVV